MRRELSYSGIRVNPTGWGVVRDLNNGEYETQWKVELRRERDAPVDDLSVIADQYSDVGLKICFSIDVTGPHSLLVRAVTPNMGSDAEYWSPTYSLLQAVDSRVGRIWKIEDKPSLWYSPFQRQRSRLLGLLDPASLVTFLGFSVQRIAPLFSEGARSGDNQGKRELYLEAVSLLNKPNVSVATLESIWDRLAEMPEAAYRDGARATDILRTDALTAIIAALSAVMYGSSSWASTSAGKLFDACYLLDENMPEGSSMELAYEEDRIWHDLALRLGQAESLSEVDFQDLFLVSQRAALNAEACFAVIEEANG